MILSDKYEITETGDQILLKEKKLPKSKETGEVTEKWVTIGHYARSMNGRKQAYNTAIHKSISALEVQSLENIISLIETGNKQIEELFGVK